MALTLRSSWCCLILETCATWLLTAGLFGRKTKPNKVWPLHMHACGHICNDMQLKKKRRSSACLNEHANTQAHGCLGVPVFAWFWVFYWHFDWPGGPPVSTPCSIGKKKLPVMWHNTPKIKQCLFKVFNFSPTVNSDLSFLFFNFCCSGSLEQIRWKFFFPSPYKCRFSSCVIYYLGYYQPCRC